MIDGSAPCVSAPPDFVNDAGLFDLRGAGRHEQRANRAAVRTVVTAYDTRGAIRTRLDDGAATGWGLRGGVPAAAEAPEAAEECDSKRTTARLAALEAEERMLAYA